MRLTSFTGLRLIALVFALAAGSLTRPAAAEGVSLKPLHQPGAATRVTVKVEVGGDLELVEEGKPVKVPMSVAAELAYHQQHLTGKDDRLARVVRYYEQASAVLKIAEGGSKPQLRENHRLIVVAAGEQHADFYSPAGQLTREELDLLDIHGDPLHLDKLLPDEEVEQGDTWKPSDAALAAVLGLDLVGKSNVEATLKDVLNSAAHIELAGIVEGGVHGIASELDFKGRLRFDLANKRIDWAALIVEEKRGGGLIGPGLDVKEKLQITISPLAKPQHFTAARLAQAEAAEAADLRLAYESPGRRVQFAHDRNWHVVSEDVDLVVLRLLEKGDLLAQCNISPLPKAQDDKQVTLKNFQTGIVKSLGERFEEIVSADERTDEQGRRVFRVAVDGKSGELLIRWIYHRVQDVQGRQAVVIFTLHQEHVGTFGDAGEAILSSLSFPAETPHTAKRSTDAQR